MRTFYIGFQSVDAVTWYNFYCSPNFRHCFLFFEGSDKESWTHPEPATVSVEYARGWSMIEAHSMWPDGVIAYLSTTSPKTTVLKIPLDAEHRLRYRQRGLIQCVSLTKSVLGITKPGIWTPKHLHDHLKSIGAETVLET